MNLNETGKQTKETEETITEEETVKLSSLETSPKKDECLELKNIKYKTMLMNGTTIQETKPSSDLDNLEKFLESERSQNKVEPWCKLDKTLKTRKLLVYAEEYKEKNKLDTEETSLLIKFLKDCLNKKKLSRVKDVVYDKETGLVSEIPSLIYNKQARHFTLKNTEKRVSTLKSLPARKTALSKPPTKKKDRAMSIDSVENLDD